jgi:hypothetical protein
MSRETPWRNFREERLQLLTCTIFFKNHIQCRSKIEWLAQKMFLYLVDFKKK